MSFQNVFWDSCVFSAYLMDEQAAYDIPSIESFLEDAKQGRLKIYASTISSAEVLPSQMKAAASFEDFMADFEGAIVPIEPNPNVMTLSGRFRDLPYRKGTSTNRRLSTPDAIMLATAVHLVEGYSVQLDCIHTFDGGGKKDLDGNRSIPLLGYETWCEGFSPEQLALANKIIQIERCKPVYPAPELPLVMPGDPPAAAAPAAE
ncbi:hypothetical protein IVB57_12080 [Bradyrhizobium sp. CW9]|uniref:type II toxin-antitoxin system VapC family toxin n=1 Tax=Bradyrhizobium sp. CW9 TaxID=2782689 RepID=UPI001FF9208F|nr:hypothetical protein [Bradyrhizobium sp. CW9]MCK1329101.1 hypothetical protein [Bradyrhizobium sp. CW9]